MSPFNLIKINKIRTLKKLVTISLFSLGVLNSSEPPTKKTKIEEEGVPAFELLNFPEFAQLPEELQQKVLLRAIDTILADSTDIQRASTLIKNLKFLSHYWNSVLSSEFGKKIITKKLSEKFNVSLYFAALYYLGPKAGFSWIYDQLDDNNISDVATEIIINNLLKEAVAHFPRSTESKKIIQAIIDNNGRYDYASVRQSDGKLLYAHQLNDAHYVIGRFHEDGTVDTSFKDIALPATVRHVHKIISLADNSFIIVARLDNLSSQIIQFKPDAQLDESFGTNGIISINEVINSIAMASHDRFIVVGKRHNGGALLSFYSTKGERKEGVVFERGEFGDLTIQPDRTIIAFGALNDANTLTYFPELIRFPKANITKYDRFTQSISDGALTPQFVSIATNGNIIAFGTILNYDLETDKEIKRYLILLFDPNLNEIDRLEIDLPEEAEEFDNE